jgi:hypothetical protein
VAGPFLRVRFQFICYSSRFFNSHSNSNFLPTLRESCLQLVKFDLRPVTVKQVQFGGQKHPVFNMTVAKDTNDIIAT